MKKLILILTALLAVPMAYSSPLPKELSSQFKDVNIADLNQDIDLTDGVLWIRMNFDAPIPEALGKSIIFSETCINVKNKAKTWKKYPFKQIKVTTLVEWKAYLFNGGQKECIEYWTKEGFSEKYSKAPYFEVWERK
ncbi:hypothetical protein [Haemophilus haemolyticus]|uniref:hypothetical protein n=1 Tax=Haemophilus haemolyticus TaxID=726 RepID=UPI000E581A27|nr:hypothetical protein [Haemophilus haemolyticus]